MAQQNNPRPIGNPPEPFDGSPKKATTFWNALDTYYTVNSDIFTDEDKRVAAALTHFKVGTPAGEWASDRMAAAAAANPQTYGTWANLKADFEKHFIPPETRLENIQKMHHTKMGQREFNDWYQEWSTYATQANPDEQTKMSTFRNCLNPRLHDKIVALSPQPDTMAALVTKVRDLDRHWHMFAPTRSSAARRPQNPRLRELTQETATAEISATQGHCNPPWKGKLTPEECKRRWDNHLCMYCGKEGHQALQCTAKPNRHPGTSFQKTSAPVRQIEAGQTEDPPSLEHLDINAVSPNYFTPPATLLDDDSGMMTASSPF